MQVETTFIKNLRHTHAQTHAHTHTHTHIFPIYSMDTIRQTKQIWVDQGKYSVISTIKM